MRSTPTSRPRSVHVRSAGFRRNVFAHDRPELFRNGSTSACAQLTNPPTTQYHWKFHEEAGTDPKPPFFLAYGTRQTCLPCESKLHFLDYWRIIRIRKTVILAVFSSWC